MDFIAFELEMLQILIVMHSQQVRQRHLHAAIVRVCVNHVVGQTLPAQTAVRAVQ
jgi:hypothetical protein